MLIREGLLNRRSQKWRLETEFIDFACKKLGGIAQVNTGNYFGKDSRFLAGFECKQAEVCGVSRSPFSGTFNYTAQCPLYIALTNKLSRCGKLHPCPWSLKSHLLESWKVGKSESHAHSAALLRSFLCEHSHDHFFLPGDSPFSEGFKWNLWPLDFMAGWKFPGKG